MLRIAALALSFTLILSCQVAVGPSSPAPATQTTASFGAVTKIAPDPSGTLATNSADWYKDAVFYHVWMAAFSDSNGDGIGDLPGVTAKLDYLKDLGVTALWLSPFFKTSSTNAALHGYDIIDYTAVDPRFGTLADVKTLLAAAHSRGMRVIFDFVPNHTSNQNPWFLDSEAGVKGKSSWYLWKASPPAAGWQDIAGDPAGSGFHLDGVNGKYYYGIFWSGMPDLNYRNPEVKTAMADVVVNWLNLGFDGMRVDAVKYLYEDESSGANVDQPETVQFFEDLRAQILDPYATAGAAKFMVAENWTGDTSSLAKYMSDGGRTGFQATLDFPFGLGVYDVLLNGTDASTALGSYYSGFFQPAAAAGGWTFTFLNNHDNYQSRPMSALGSVQKVRLAQTLQMVAWGTPILYYGNEIGMPGVSGNDANFRRTFDWTKVAAAQADPNSNYSWQKTLDQIRLSRSSLRRGSLALPGATPGTLAVLRTLGTEATLVVINLTAAPMDSTVDLSGLSLGTSVSTLVGTGSPTITGSSLTASQFPGLGVRIYALETGALANLRGDFTDGPPQTTLTIAVKDSSTAVLTASFYDGTGTTKIGDVVPQYNGNGGYWWASMAYPMSATQGQVEVTRAAQGAQASATTGRIPFTITTPGTPQSLWPALNTGSAPAWYLRGIGGDWNSGLPMTEVTGEPGHFLVTLTPAQAPVTGISFKINSSATTWDYFFGYWDVVYDKTQGDDPTALGWGWADLGNYNMAFTPTGTNAYEIHFVNQPGFCKVWIRKVTG